MTLSNVSKDSVLSFLATSFSKRQILALLGFVVACLNLLYFFGPVAYTLYQPTRISDASTQTQLLAANGQPVIRANATLFMLCRNEELAGVVSSVRQVEDRFNKRFGYPWVFLNDVPFTEDFKRRVSNIIHSEVFFGLITDEQWKQPDWIDEEKATQAREKMGARRVPYALSVSYRNMCRFNSGFFYNHELLQPYRYYWRIEPDVQYYCDMHYDPFAFMERNNKTYGFTISLLEIPATAPTLWSAVKEFMGQYPNLIHPNNTMKFLSDDNGAHYNWCHFWSNFEIADMDFYRGEAYTKFFEFLDSKGGFYYERWGDAPVHSIAVSLLTAKNNIHYFRDIGYRHDSFSHCPPDMEWISGRCTCAPNESFNRGKHSCTWGWENLVH